MRGATDGRAELDEVAAHLGGRVRAAETVGWGDARATYHMTLDDGRSFAARRPTGREPSTRADGIVRLMTRLIGAGLPVPPPVVIETDAGPWLLTPWVDGESGADWLEGPERARHLADRMGRLARRLRAIEPVDVGLRSEPSASDDHADDTESLALVHGDFAPVNVVLDASGEIRALLDFEHAGLGPADLDVAWWGWVVRHHHPEAWTAAWPTFLSAAGLERGTTEATLHAIVLRALADRAVDADDDRTRRRWLERLDEARGWRVPGDQAT